MMRSRAELPEPEHVVGTCENCGTEFVSQHPSNRCHALETADQCHECDKVCCDSCFDFDFAFHCDEIGCGRVVCSEHVVTTKPEHWCEQHGAQYRSMAA